MEVPLRLFFKPARACLGMSDGSEILKGGGTINLISNTNLQNIHNMATKVGG